MKGRGLPSESTVVAEDPVRVGGGDCVRAMARVRTAHGAAARASGAVAQCLLCGVMLTGCAGRTIEPAAALVPKGAEPKLDWVEWGLTLARAVVDDKVDYAKLLEDRRPLDRFLALVSRVGPQSTPDQFPTRNDRLAYAINCHNAAIVRSVLALARGGTLPAYLPSDLETRFRFRIDGRLQTAADLRREVESLAGDDWRVRFALTDGTMSGPPLARNAFLGDLLDAQLNQVTQSALQAPGVVRIDHGEQGMFLWRGLYEIKDRLIREYETETQARDASFLNVLCQWADRHRRELLNTAVGYEVALMPADNRPDAVEPPPPERPKGLFSAFSSITFLRPQ